MHIDLARQTASVRAQQIKLAHTPSGPSTHAQRVSRVPARVASRRGPSRARARRPTQPSQAQVTSSRVAVLAHDQRSCCTLSSERHGRRAPALAQRQGLRTSTPSQHPAEPAQDKRKAAALEVERLIRDALSKDDTARVGQLIHQLCELCAAPSVTTRNGGLMGIAGAAIAFGPTTIAPYLSTIMQPIITGMADADSKVRYFGASALLDMTDEQPASRSTTSPRSPRARSCPSSASCSTCCPSSWPTRSGPSATAPS